MIKRTATSPKVKEFLAGTSGQRVAPRGTSKRCIAARETSTRWVAARGMRPAAREDEWGRLLIMEARQTRTIGAMQCGQEGLSGRGIANWILIVLLKGTGELFGDIVELQESNQELLMICGNEWWTTTRCDEKQDGWISQRSSSSARTAREEKRRKISSFWKHFPTKRD